MMRSMGAILILFLSTLSLRRATMHALKLADTMLFLSTLSLRRATHQEWSGSQQPRDFYPRSPCGERRVNEDRYGQQY